MVIIFFFWGGYEFQTWLRNRWVKGPNNTQGSITVEKLLPHVVGIFVPKPRPKSQFVEFITRNRRGIFSSFCKPYSVFYLHSLRSGEHSEKFWSSQTCTYKYFFRTIVRMFLPTILCSNTRTILQTWYSVIWGPTWTH